MLFAHLTKLLINLNITQYLHLIHISLIVSKISFLLLLCLNWHPSKVYTFYVIVTAHKPLLFCNCLLSFFVDGFAGETRPFLLVECATVCEFGRLFCLWWCSPCFSRVCISWSLVIRSRGLIRYRFDLFRQAWFYEAGIFYKVLHTCCGVIS